MTEHPILSTSARTFDNLFQVVGEVQLETRSENPIGSMPAMSIGPRGEILVIDRVATRLAYLFDSKGAFLTTVGRRGRGPGEYEAPDSPAFDNAGNIYIYDLVKLTLNKYSPEGEFTKGFRLKKYFRKLVIDNQGSMIFYTSAKSNAEETTLFKYDSNGNLVASFAPFPESYVEGGASGGGGVAIDSSSTIYHITPYEYRVSAFMLNGELLRTFDGKPSYFRPIGGSGLNPQSSPKDLGAFHASWTHIQNIQIFENSVIMVFAEDRNQGEARYYLDLYDLGGAAIQVGIECSEDVALRSFADSSTLHVLTEQAPAKNADLLNPKVLSYRLKPYP